MPDTELVDGSRERTRTRQTSETDVDETDDETTVQIRHYEEQIRELYCEHCNDWHDEEEMVPVGIDVEPGEDPEAFDVMCQYHANAFFGYEPDAEDPVYQPIVDEVEHWTWREMVTAVAMPVASIIALMVTVSILIPAVTTFGESMLGVMEAMFLQPMRVMTTAAGAEGSFFDDIMLPIWLGVGALWILSKFGEDI